MLHSNNPCTHPNIKALCTPVPASFSSKMQQHITHNRQLIFENLDDGKAMSVSAVFLAFSVRATDPEPRGTGTIRAWVSTTQFVSFLAGPHSPHHIPRSPWCRSRHGNGRHRLDSEVCLSVCARMHRSPGCDLSEP